MNEGTLYFPPLAKGARGFERTEYQLTLVFARLLQFRIKGIINGEGL
jgi:hypothetical protein